MYKPALIVVLVALNLALLTALAFVAPGPAPAYAQAVPQAGNYVLVTAKIQDDHDALYLLDLASRTLHALTFDMNTRRLQYRGARSLLADFARTSAPAATR